MVCREEVEAIGGDRDRFSMTARAIREAGRLDAPGIRATTDWFDGAAFMPCGSDGLAEGPRSLLLASGVREADIPSERPTAGG